MQYNSILLNYFQGIYPFEYDLNVMQHGILPEWEYGLMKMKIDVTNNKRSVICSQAIMEVLPI